MDLQRYIINVRNHYSSIFPLHSSQFQSLGSTKCSCKMLQNMKPGKRNLGFSYGKFCSIFLELFLEPKLWNWQECIIYSIFHNTIFSDLTFKMFSEMDEKLLHKFTRYMQNMILLLWILGFWRRKKYFSHLGQAQKVIAQCLDSYYIVQVQLMHTIYWWLEHNLFSG